MEEAIVKVENLSHRYSVQWAIQGISFDVQKNGIQGLLGSNGLRHYKDKELYTNC